MAITGYDMQDFWDKLKEMGIGPNEDCRRVIIDIPCDGAVKVYYECYADQRMFNIELVNALKDAEVIGVSNVQ